MALALAVVVSTACPISSHRISMSNTAADGGIGIGMACAAPPRAGI